MAEHLKHADKERPLPGWIVWSIGHGLLITLTLTVLVRMVHWLSVRACDPLYGQTLKGFDMHTYVTWAKQIAEGDLLSTAFTHGEPFYYGPLYAYFLAALFRMFGENYDVIHGIQALLGLVAPLSLWSVARRLFGKGPALATGLMTALCAPIFFYEQVLLMEGLLVAIHAGILWFLVRGQESTRTRWCWALGAGILSGLACWGRGNLLLVIPLIAAVWIVLPRLIDLTNQSEHMGSAQPSSKGRRRHWFRSPLMSGFVCGVAYLLGAALPLSLSLWRNVSVSGQAVVVTSSGPILLYIGNAPDATGLLAYSPVYYEQASRRDHLENDLMKLREERSAAAESGETERVDRLTKRLSEMEKQHKSFWRNALFRDICQEPGRWLQLTLKKGYLFWNSYDIADNVSYYANKRYSVLMRLSPVTWVTLVPLAFFGLFCCSRLWRAQLFLYVYAFGFALSVIAVFIVGRYRLEETLPMLVWAGPAVSETLKQAWHGRWSRVNRLGVVLATGIVLLWPNWSPGAKVNSLEDFGRVPLVRNTDYLSLAIAHSRLGQRDQARQLLEEALESYPAYEAAATELALLYAENGMARRGIEILERQVTSGGAGVEVTLTLAQLYALEGQTVEAVGLLKRVLLTDPKNATALKLLHEFRQLPDR